MTPAFRSIPVWVLRLVEWAGALTGAVICIGVVLVFATQQASAGGPLWPIPGLYFGELIILALIGLASRLGDVGSPRYDLGAVTWMAGGVLLPFVILGGFSIGPFLFPGLLAFWLAAAAGDVRQGRAIPLHLGLAVVAAILQAAIMAGMLLLVRG